MEKASTEGAGSTLPLPPPPSIILPNGNPDEVDLPKHTITNRLGVGTDGRHIPLLTNFFRVYIKLPDGVFYHYDVSITSEDGRPVESKGIGRKVINQLYQTYPAELSRRHFAYDGEKSLYTTEPLPCNNFEFMVIVEETFAKRESGGSGGSGSSTQDGKKSKHSFQSKTFKVGISYASKFPIRSLSLDFKETKPDRDSQEALRVLDVILRQQAANRGCLLVRQSFFCDDSRNFTDIGGGAIGCRGFHASFRTTQSGLALNMDVSTTMIVKPGPVLEFLLSNQNVRDPRHIDWEKAKRMLKNLKIKTRHTNMKFKICGLSEKRCVEQMFPFKVNDDDTGSGGGKTVDISVCEYYRKHRNIELSSSLYMPCLNVGRSKRPNFLPLELCDLISLQRYKKALSTTQRSSLVEQSRQKPPERIRMVTDAVKNHHYEEDPMLATCGISIEKQLTQVDGRVLEAPKLKVGKLEDCVPRNGRWNFNNKKLLSPTRIECWAVVNFSARCDTSYLSRELINCGRTKGIHIERPYTLIEEDLQSTRDSAAVRVERMFEQLIAKLPDTPEFLLCVLPERKTSELYGPWKKKALTDLGIVTQCISPTKITDQYLTNVLLKINSKLGGINSLLAMEHPSCIPLMKDTPTMILGMDVTHGPPGQSEIPSFAAVVGSRAWPLISRYKASVRTQSPKKEMIESLYKPLENGNDDGIIRELLIEFYRSSNGRKPTQIIIFRGGVSESKFSQVLDFELEQIMKAYQHLGEADLPKFMVIVAQRNHHTKLFQAGAPENVPPGTVVDTNIVHPSYYDFYVCSHAGVIGTSRPTHYYVLLDEIGFTPNELQNFINSLSYVYQRSTSAISVVAPICYARLAAQQMGQFIKFEDLPETSGQNLLVQELPRLHKKVQASMFFC